MRNGNARLKNQDTTAQLDNLWIRCLRIVDVNLLEQGIIRYNVKGFCKFSLNNDKPYIQNLGSYLYNTKREGMSQQCDCGHLKLPEILSYFPAHGTVKWRDTDFPKTLSLILKTM